MTKTTRPHLASVLLCSLAAAAAGEMVTVRLGTPAAAPRAARAKTPTAYVIEATADPKLDGKLDEDVWAKAPVLRLARTLDGSGAAPQPTEARLCRRGETLYVAIRAVEPLMGRLRASRRGHDGAVWDDDSIEIFLGVRGVGYCHFGVNAVASTYDGRAKDSSWNAGAGFRAAAGRDKSAYTLEIAIPLRAVAPKGDLPTEWILNVNRNRQAMGRWEEASWSPTGSGNSHVPERFGRMLLKDPPPEEKEVVVKEDLKVIPTAEGEGVLVFDLSVLPKGAKVRRADLRIFRTAEVDGQFDEALVDIEVYPLFETVAAGAAPKVAGGPLAIRGPWFDRLDATDAVGAWAGGRTNGGFYVRACPFLNAAATCLDIAYEGKPNAKKLPKQVTSVKAVHRGGQTFITWKEITDPVGRDEIQWGQLKQVLEDLDRTGRLRYVVYRHTGPITAGNLHEAEPVAAVRPCSAWNVNGRSIERGIDWNLAHKYAHVHGHWNPFGPATMDGPWGRDCPIDRLVIADGGEPLPRTTGLYVHTPSGSGRAHYAVVTRLDGVENTLAISGANTAGPIEEAAGEPQPVLQGKLEAMPFWNYPEERLHYVRWVGPPYANRPSEYYNWAVAVPTEKLSETYALELHLHSDDRSYWRTPYRLERDSIVVCPHDFPVATWWYGHHESLGTLRSFRQGRVHNYTERRVLWFLEWVGKKWPVDGGRISVTAVNHRAGGPGISGRGGGSSGALHLGLRYPEIFNKVLPDQGNPDYGSAAHGTMQRIWGRVDWRMRTDKGANVWDELDLVRLVTSYPASKELPLVTFTGRSLQTRRGDKPATVSLLIAALLAKAAPVMIFFDEWGGPKLVPVSTTGTWPAPMIRLDVRKDRLLPAFNRLRAEGFRSGKVRFSRLNLEYRWADPVDTPQRAEVSLWRVGERSGPTADVTLRRLRRFQVAPGKTYAWKMGDQNGEVTADKDGLITIPGVALPTAPARLVVTSK